MLHLKQGICSYSKCHHKHLQILQKYFSQLIGHQSVGIIIIGDEILKAQVKDTNSHYMCNLLYKHGVRVKKISVISDDINEISMEIKDFSDKYTYVITAGGIGPTHDDVTYEGLAKAFNDSLHYHPTLVDIIKNKFGYKDAMSPGYKMAYVPQKAMLKFLKEETGRQLLYPSIFIKNVYVFPGSPVYLEKSFTCLCKELFSSNVAFAKDELFMNIREELFANALTVVSKEFPHVAFGSYPVSNCSYYKARVTIESDNKEETQRAKERFCHLAPPNILVDYDPLPHVDSLRKYRQLVEKSQHSCLWESSLNVIEKSYGDTQRVVVCVDGGVGSSVLLHLAHLAINRLNSKDKLQIVYCKNGSNPNVTNFIREMAERYNANVIFVNGELPEAIQELTLSKQQLTILLTSEKILPSNFAIANGLTFSFPLSNWTDENMWTFIKSLSLPYHSIYNE